MYHVTRRAGYASLLYGLSAIGYRLSAISYWHIPTYDSRLTTRPCRLADAGFALQQERLAELERQKESRR